VRSPSSVLAALQRECAQLRRQCARQQTLLRLAQRTLGVLPAAPGAARPSAKKQRRRPTVRALRVVDQLRQQEPELQSKNGVNDKGVTP
jgi:hypothetical protein